ncbi:hypothetical protein EDEG_01554 [Edhazardia aedis USNM 41457]|uniref:Uncharacterized protein n=1 Tax=Edhazardia aedis (strain USNM 41457) TaxID=1003232 RepID=J9D9I8_EDHAE|nr:hypothetical protein EDEG_01554 [Edhazardia aedis USNM 41457]|eukprot:EJW04159.1 hypothetical protein EDEG_01554 [Edhazardia aedis USNM 41457]
MLINPEGKALGGNTFFYIEVAIFLGVFTALIIWFWIHSYKADKAANKAFSSFDTYICTEKKIFERCAKKINTSCLFAISYCLQKKALGFNIIKSTANSEHYKDIKNKLIQITEKKTYKGDEVSRFLFLLNQIFNETMHEIRNKRNMVYIVTLDSDPKFEHIQYPSAATDNLFSFIRDSDAYIMKSSCNKFFSLLKEIVTAENDNFFFVIADDYVFQTIKINAIHNLRNKNVESISVALSKFKLSEKGDAKMYNILQYAVFALEKAGYEYTGQDTIETHDV